MAIYFTGDLHGNIDINKLSYKYNPELKNLTNKDYLIILGDFGLIWDVNESKEIEKYWINWLTNKPWVTLFVDGNHENFDRLNKLTKVNMFGGKVGKVNNKIFHLKRGYIYNIENKEFFIMGGEESVDRYHRTEFISWWKQEIPSQKEMAFGLDNLTKNNLKVDYILCHTIPGDIIKEYLLEDYLSNYFVENALHRYLDIINKTIKFKKWYCGHWHLDKTFGKYNLLYDNIILL